MNSVFFTALGLSLYLLLTGAQCTETVTTTEIRSSQKISADEGNFNGDLDADDRFGSSVASAGDLEGDGVIDLAVGAPGDDDGGDNRGAVWILFMDSNGRVDTQAKISETAGLFSGDLENDDRFGAAVAGLGDLNGDGFSDIAVGAPGDDDGGDNRGAVWILFMNADGSVQSSQKVSDQQGNFGGNLDNNDEFGSALAGIGDFDGDGVPDLAASAPRANSDSVRSGSVWILFMQANGSVRESRRIDSDNGSFDGNLSEGDSFGSSIASLGDLNADGVTDLAVGANGSDTGGSVWLLFLNSNGSVGDQRRIASNDSGFEGSLDDGDGFGSAVAGLGDIDGDGVTELAVGAPGAEDGGEDRGAVWVLFMRTDGRVEDQLRISSTDGKLDENLDNGDRFGSALAALGDLNAADAVDMAVGVPGDDDDKNDAGALLILFMERREDEQNTGFF
jgi:hypothetical protein